MSFGQIREAVRGCFFARSFFGEGVGDRLAGSEVGKIRVNEAVEGLDLARSSSSLKG